MSAFIYNTERHLLQPGENWPQAVERARTAHLGGFINFDGFTSLGRMAAGAIDVVGQSTTDSVDLSSFATEAVPPLTPAEVAGFEEAIAIGLQQLNPRTVEV